MKNRAITIKCACQPPLSFENQISRINRNRWPAYSGRAAVAQTKKVESFELYSALKMLVHECETEFAEGKSKSKVRALAVAGEALLRFEVSN